MLRRFCTRAAHIQPRKPALDCNIQMVRLPSRNMSQIIQIIHIIQIIQIIQIRDLPIDRYAGIDDLSPRSGVITVVVAIYAL